MTASSPKHPARNPQPLDRIRELVLPITNSHRVRNVRIFGSFARGEQTRRSDVDLLVDLPDDMSLIGLCGLKHELEGALKRKVDIVPAGNIKPALQEYILADARPL